MVELNSKDSSSSCPASTARGAQRPQTESVEEGFRRCAEMVVGAFSSEQLLLASSPGLSALYKQLATLVTPSAVTNMASPSPTGPVPPIAIQPVAAPADLVDGYGTGSGRSSIAPPTQRSPQAVLSPPLSCALAAPGPARTTFEEIPFQTNLQVAFARPQLPPIGHPPAGARMIPSPLLLQNPKPSPFAIGQPLPPLLQANPNSVKFGSMYLNNSASIPHFFSLDFPPPIQNNTGQQQQQVTSMHIGKSSAGVVESPRDSTFPIPVDLADFIPSTETHGFSQFLQPPVPFARAYETRSIPSQPIGHRPFPMDASLNPPQVPSLMNNDGRPGPLQPAPDSNNNKHIGLQLTVPAAPHQQYNAGSGHDVGVGAGAFVHNTPNIKSVIQRQGHFGDTAEGGRASALPAVSTILSPEPKRVPLTIPMPMSANQQLAVAAPSPVAAGPSHVQPPYSAVGGGGEFFGQPQVDFGFPPVPPWHLPPLPPVTAQRDSHVGLGFASTMSQRALPEMGPQMLNQEMNPRDNMTSTPSFVPPLSCIFK